MAAKFHRLTDVVDDHGYTVTRVSDYVLFELEDGKDVDEIAKDYKLDMTELKEFAEKNGF